MSCNNNLNVSLSASCQEEVTFDLIVEATSNCDPATPDAFQITVYNAFGTLPLPSSPMVTSAQIGQTLTVKATHLPSGNACWGSITIYDQLAPAITCPPNQTVHCNSPIDPDLMGYAFVLDCSAYTTSHYDTYQDLGCNDPMGIVNRTWLSTDSYGNMSSCVQSFTVQQATLGNVTFPANLDGLALPALPCTSPNTTPANTGVPTIDGEPIPSSGSCSISTVYADQVVPTCGNAFTVLRTWTVLEWCTGNLQQATQIIAVKDQTAPLLTGPDTLFMAANDPLSCTGTFLLPQVAYTESCSNPVTFSVLTPFGLVQGNGGLMTQIPAGDHLIEYRGTDACGNIGSLAMVLRVEDQLAPTPICDQITTVSLTADGSNLIPAAVFDDGSFDNCCLDALLIRRLAAGCGDDGSYGPWLSVCCEDLEATLSVQLKIQDCSGNENTCTVSAIIEDKIAPEIVCPNPVVLACDANYDNTGLTGLPLATDACGVDASWYTDDIQLNSCQIGTIYRTWEAQDASGNSASCLQLIELEDQTPLEIFFPEALTLYGCADVDLLHPDLLDAPYSYPTYTGKDCEQVGVNYEDQVFLTPGDACLKVIRTWTLIDWCEYEPNSGNTDGYYQALQTLKVLDTVPPEITCPLPQVLSTSPNSCDATVGIAPAAWLDACNSDVELEIETPWGTGAGPFTEVLPGTYSIHYSVTDGCGNTSYCSSTLTVEDQIKPTPYCSAGQIVVLSPMDIDGDGQFDTGTAQITASAFDEGSFDNCSAVVFSFSQALTDSVRTFSCDQVGTQLLELWVHDSAGNQDLCFTQINIQDNQFYCNGGVPPTLSGRISTVSDIGVENVLMQINAPGNPAVETDAAGNFAFSGLQIGTYYEIVPFKDENLLDGVTTWDLVLIQRHILGVELLPTPHQIIAGDADGSGFLSTVDIVALQKLIMHLENSLPNAMPSWKFIPSSYTFQNPDHPLNENYPESLVVGFEAQDVENVLFTGIKIGDTNGSAQGNLAGLEARTIMPLGLRWNGKGSGRSFELYTLEPVKIYGLQFALHLEGGEMENWTTEPGAALSSAFSAVQLAERQDYLSMSVFDAEAQALPEGTVLLRGIISGATVHPPIIHFADSWLPSEIYLETRETQALELRETSTIVAQASEKNIEILRISPNPVISGTKIGYRIAEPQDVFLRLWDQQGRLAFQSWIYQSEAGENTIELPATAFVQPGVYWVELQAGSEAQRVQLVYVGE